MASNRRSISVFELILRSEEKVSCTRPSYVSLVSSHSSFHVHGPCLPDNQIALVFSYLCSAPMKKILYNNNST